MAIVSALFGIGVGVFHKLNRPEQMAARVVTDTLRSARLFARAETAPSSVVVRPAAGEVTSMGLRTVGNWHFEDVAGTGWPFDAVHPSTALIAEGAVGSGLRLDGGDELSLPSPPGTFDSPFGFLVEVSLRPAADRRPMTILERRNVWTLDLDDDDVLRVSLHVEAPDGTAPAGTSPVSTSDGGRTSARLSVHEIPGARLSSTDWSRVLVLFDGRALHVTVNGRRAGDDVVFDAPLRLARNPGVSIGTGAEVVRYRGLMDELRIGSVIVGERQPLPTEVLLEGVDRVLHFDAFGRLDPAWHRGPVEISFLHGEPARRSLVEVGLLGTVRVREEPAEPDALRQLEALRADVAATPEGGGRP